jgi:hypothetical protein
LFCTQYEAEVLQHFFRKVAYSTNDVYPKAVLDKQLLSVEGAGIAQSV